MELNKTKHHKKLSTLKIQGHITKHLLNKFENLDEMDNLLQI